MRNVLITGGAGFVGASLAISFKRDHPSWRIIAFDNLHRRGSELNVPRLKENGVDFVHGDVRIAEDLRDVGAFDLLIECSAEPSVLAGYTGSPAYLCQTNLSGTLNCLETCRKQRSELIFLSTSRVYPMEVISGLEYLEEETRFRLKPDQDVPGVSAIGFSEDFPMTGARSLYGATKLCSELMIQEYLAAFDLKGVIARCGVIAGPWQMGRVDQGFVALWLARHLWSGDLRYIGYGGNGKQVRDILHVDDLYELLRMMTARVAQISGSVFNVGGGMDLSVSLHELTGICRKITGQRIPIASVPETRQADIPYYVSDFRRIQAITGWKPWRGIAEIMEETCAWLRDHEAALRSILV